MLHDGFQAALNPQSIAIVGASRSYSDHGERFGRGNRFVAHLRDKGYQGRVYPVNPNAAEILGYKCYASVPGLPEVPDLVIVSVPARLVPGVLEDCGRAGARNVHIFSSGFSEIGTLEGRALEDQVREAASRYGLNVIGPNCMGIAYVPAHRVTTLDHVSMCEPGNVAFLSQSGGHCVYFVLQAADYGINFSRVISYGNAAVMDSTDFIPYLTADPDTRVVCLYIEGVKDGKKLFCQIRELNRVKPVIIWKGGATGPGSRVAGSHTGSLTGDSQVWGAFFKQTGAVRVEGNDELSDMAHTLLYAKRLPEGNRVAIIGSGGGSSVAATDICAAEGLEVPALSPQTFNSINELITVVGHILTNPLDVANVYRDLSLLERVLSSLDREPRADMLLVSLPMEHLSQPEFLDNVAPILASFSEHSRKPLGVVVFRRRPTAEVVERQEAFTRELARHGVLTYSSFSCAVRAFRKLSEYGSFLRSRGIPARP